MSNLLTEEQTCPEDNTHNGKKMHKGGDHTTLPQSPYWLPRLSHSVQRRVILERRQHLFSWNARFGKEAQAGAQVMVS